MNNSLRYNPPEEWNQHDRYNRYFYGLLDLCRRLYPLIEKSPNRKFLEIGSYNGESTSIFASTKLFSSITCLDPFSGEEKANSLFNKDWTRVKKEFWTNTRHWDNIKLVEDFSYNVVDKFKDKEFDFIYIDASHEYKDVKFDIESYLSKTTLAIGGHDYHESWPGVKKAVDEIFGSPDEVYDDTSWIKFLH